MSDPEVRRVWLVCPDGHVVLGMVYSRRLMTEAEACQRLVSEGLLLDRPPWCPVCGSGALHFEHGRFALGVTPCRLEARTEPDHARRLKESA